jgi:hypothetical protein
MPPVSCHPWAMEILAALLLIVTMAYLQLHEDD